MSRYQKESKKLESDFESGFGAGVPGGTCEYNAALLHDEIIPDDLRGRPDYDFAYAFTRRAREIVSRDKQGRPLTLRIAQNCNQEPCADELRLQRLRNVPASRIRQAALDARYASFGIPTNARPLTPPEVRSVILESMQAFRAATPLTKEHSDWLAMAGIRPGTIRPT